MEYMEREILQKCTFFLVFQILSCDQLLNKWGDKTRREKMNSRWCNKRVKEETTSEVVCVAAETIRVIWFVHWYMWPATGGRFNWSIMYNRCRNNGNIPQLQRDFISYHCLRPSGGCGSRQVSSAGQNMTGPAAQIPADLLLLLLLTPLCASGSARCTTSRRPQELLFCSCPPLPSLFRCRRDKFNGDSKPLGDISALLTAGGRAAQGVYWACARRADWMN